MLKRGCQALWSHARSVDVLGCPCSVLYRIPLAAERGATSNLYTLNLELPTAVLMLKRGVEPAKIETGGVGEVSITLHSPTTDATQHSPCVQASPCGASPPLQ